jgi:hypothetical protein
MLKEHFNAAGNLSVKGENVNRAFTAETKNRGSGSKSVGPKTPLNQTFA